LKILVAAAGSHGDVLPLIALAAEFAVRGHEVVLHASGYFAPQAAAAGVALRALGTPQEHVELLQDPDLTHPVRAHRRIAAALDEFLPRLHESLSAGVDPGRTVVIGSVLAFPARLLRDTRGVPCVIVHLAPATLRSCFESPRITRLDPGPWLPRALKALAWRALDRWVIDPVYGAPLNRYRRSLGLAPVRSVFDHWLNGADLLLALFPDWFAAPQPDWPATVLQTGFPLYDQATQVLAPPLREFLEAGEPPIGFTAGTATASASEFYTASVAACVRAGRRGILLAHRPEQIPHTLPPGILHVPYVPFSDLLPRLAAFVHHGGIGTTSQALRAGVPQLIRPMAYDQLDNSRRAQRLGVARELLPARYEARRAARLLEPLIHDPSVRERCRHWAARLARPDAVRRSCDRVLAQFLTRE